MILAIKDFILLWLFDNVSLVICVCNYLVLRKKKHMPNKNLIVTN